MGIRQFKACLDTLNVGFEYKPKTSKNDIPLIFSGCIEISIGEVAVFAESKAFIYTKFVCQWILSEPLRCPDGRIIKKYWESDSLEKKPDSWRSCSPFLLYRKIVSMCKRETIRVLDRRQWKKGKKMNKSNLQGKETFWKTELVLLAFNTKKRNLGIPHSSNQWNCKSWWLTCERNLDRYMN